MEKEAIPVTWELLRQEGMETATEIREGKDGCAAGEGEEWLTV